MLTEYFPLTCPIKKSVLVISNAGYQTQEMVVGSATSFNIDLALAVNQLNEVVVVGYGTQKKVTVTGAVSAIKGDVLVKSPAVDMTNSLAGRLPGLVVIKQAENLVMMALPFPSGVPIRLETTATSLLLMVFLTETAGWEG
jgi:hypothetical protein